MLPGRSASVSSFSLLRQSRWQPLRTALRRPQQLARRRPYSSSEPPPSKPTAQSSSSSNTNSSPTASKTSSTPSSSPSSSTSSSASASASGSASAAAEKTASRFSRLHGRLPRFLQRYTSALRAAPVSHVTAFLVLHELTAVVPLLGFGWYFYRADSLPWFAQGAWFDAGVKRFGSYFRRKGLLGPTESQKLDRIENERGAAEASEAEDGEDGKRLKGKFKSWWGQKKDAIVQERDGPTRREKWWGRGENGVRLVTSFAAAYALTKALLPARLILSAWMTPLFARTTIVPITRGIRNMFKRK